MPVAGQQVHQRYVHSGPLVLGAALRNIPTPTADRDRTVSRRSEPSSRTALNGEQPYPWDLLQPQDAMSRHRGAKPPRRCELLGEISLLSPEYLLSFERRPFHSENRRITKPCFRSCSTCMSCSQAPLCFYTLRTIADRAEGTFGSLRYCLGGDRPSQTTHHTLSSRWGIRIQRPKGWYFTDDSTPAGAGASGSPTYPAHRAAKANVKL